MATVLLLLLFVNFQASGLLPGSHPVSRLPIGVSHQGLPAVVGPSLHRYLLLEVQNRTAQRKRRVGICQTTTRSLLQVRNSVGFVLSHIHGNTLSKLRKLMPYELRHAPSGGEFLVWTKWRIVYIFLYKFGGNFVFHYVLLGAYSYKQSRNLLRNTDE